MDKNPNDPGQTDYIQPGGERHMHLLRIRKQEPGDLAEYCFQGYTFADLGEVLGPFVRPEYTRDVLRQRVAELKGGPAKVPGNAPRLWQPAD